MLDQLQNIECHYPLKKGEFFIYDDNENNIPKFVSREEKWSLTILNNSDNQINFFQNDGCIMSDNNTKKCDWICFDENDFYFIEAKDVKQRSRSKQRKDAEEKFVATLEFYKRYSFPKGIKKYAILNFRDNKIASASGNTNKAIYQKLGLKYIETNLLEFNN